MPTTVSVGLSKKIGLPDYGSLGANCQVTFEVDGSQLKHDLEAFHRSVSNTYVACRQAIEDELSRQQSAQPTPSNPLNESSRTTTNGHSRRNGSNGAGNNHGPRASDKQLNYARQLASQINGGIQLEPLVTRMYDKPSSALNSFEASGLIDQLKAIKSGTIQIEDLQDAVAS